MSSAGTDHPAKSSSTSSHDSISLNSARPSTYGSSPPNSAVPPFIPEDEPHSFDLVPVSDTCPDPRAKTEDHADRVFGPDHLKRILSHPTLLSKFADFLERRNTDGLRLLVYYLDAQKALRALRYANAIIEGLEPLEGRAFTEGGAQASAHPELSRKADGAFQGLVEELAAFVTQTFVDVTSHNVSKRITGTLKAELRDAVDGLGESFCLTDPSRPDNPIIFMSEEFNRVTQYGVSYVVGKNCRFLQGPRTDRGTVRRLRDAIAAGREVSELFVNYRRDGSPFMNLLMCAPLRDSNGTVKYFIGAQVDVTQPFLENIGLESMQQPDGQERRQSSAENAEQTEQVEHEPDEFRDLVELFNDSEIATAKHYGGHLHRGRKKLPVRIRRANARGRGNHQRVLIQDPTPEREESPIDESSEEPVEPPRTGGGLLKGVYQHYLLVRPYPSLRILFTSPSLRTPGIYQMPFMDKVGGSIRVKTQLVDALHAGNGVTAKITWITNRDTDEGRERWAHCTPLFDAAGNVGVWMVVLVDIQNPVYFSQGRSQGRNNGLEEYGPHREARARARYRETLDVYEVEHAQRLMSMSPSPPNAERQLPPCSSRMPPTPPPRTSSRHDTDLAESMGRDGFVLGVPPPGRSSSRTPSHRSGRSALENFAKNLSMIASN